MLDDLANAEDNTLIEDGKKVENLIAEFPFRFESVETTRDRWQVST